MRKQNFLGVLGFALLSLALGCSDEPISTSSELEAQTSDRAASKVLAAESCTSPEWNVTVTYARGDMVSHNNSEWRAKKNHSGVEPGSHPAYWANRGSCDAEPPEPPGPGERTPIQIFGIWHAGNHYADWALPRVMGESSEFDAANRWIIDRGDGRPSVNLVVLSFLQPLDVLNMTPGAPESGVPVGMTQEVVNYFKNAGIRVMMSVGGVTYIDFWNEALATDATQLGLNAAAIASYFGVGIEIDYEENRNPDLVGLQAFVDAYRSVHAYDPTGAKHEARLTIDLAAGDRYLQDLTRYATVNWLNNENPVLDYANAMVARSSGTPADWQEHVDGKPQYDPPIPALAPNRFTGGLYLKGNTDNCLDYFSSEQYEHRDYVETVLPNGAGVSPGMLGFMFWAAEFPSARKNYVGTVPPNTCEGGMGVAATEFDLPIPMGALHQE